MPKDQRKHKEMLPYGEHKLWNTLTQAIVEGKSMLWLKRKLGKFMENRPLKSNLIGMLQLQPSTEEALQTPPALGCKSLAG